MFRKKAEKKKILQINEISSQFQKNLGIKQKRKSSMF